MNQGRRSVYIALFLASLGTTFGAGLLAASLDPYSPGSWTAQGVLGAAGYSLWLMAILTCHEAGHYLAARRRGVEVSRPYFLPGLGPIPGFGVVPFFGTFGAFIRMSLQRMKAVDLMAIAGWGPVAGFLITVPAVFIGVAASTPEVLSQEEGLMHLGDPLLMRIAASIFHPEMKPDQELMLHPIGLAGWVGCLLTALNLLPLGQLDGGHLTYGVLGERSALVSKVLFGLMILVGVLCFPGWLVLAGLIWWMGIVHPPLLDGPPAKGKERWMAIVCGVIFVLTFVPVPIRVEGMSLLSLW